MLTKSKTALIIRLVLRYKIAQYLKIDNTGVPTTPDDQLGNILSQGIEKQAHIGWKNFLKGRVSKEFGDAQQIFYNTVYPNGMYTRKHWMGNDHRSVANFL
eukprot:2354885-Ditylum_brightwellii.AAC.1